ncbi:MAG TPA: AtpZ/AtpI family protein [Chloroflexota bacterium]|nr:AtpZ/AtpI family protein [Chloroflexota bacterium]
MRRDLAPVALISQLGLTMVGSILLGLVIGLWIDAHFGTKPWATLILSLVGVFVGSISVYRLVVTSIDQAADEMHRDQKKKDDGDQPS